MARSSRRASRAVARASVSCAAALSAAAGVGLLGSAPARGEHFEHKIATLGFLDSLHTNSDGKHFSTVLNNQTNAIGQVAGSSARFDSGGTTTTGDSAWFFNPGLGSGTLTQVGLVTGDHVRTTPGPAQSSIVTHLNDDSVAGGFSKRYDNANNGADAGQSAWFYRSGGISQRIGLFDAGNSGDYTNIGKYQFSEVKGISDTGWVIGNSARYDASAALVGDARHGASAWIHDGTAGSTATSSVRIGLIDAEHTSSDPTPKQTSSALFVNDDGKAAGTSARYVGEDQRGNSAWLWTGSGTVKIGLTDAPDYEKVISAGVVHKESTVVGMNNNADVHVIGTSNRYSGSADRGTAAWRHVGTSSGGTTRIGLFGDTEHRDHNQSETSAPLKMNEAGHVVGFSTRHNGTANDLGQSLWLYKGTGTGTRIGLVGAGYTKVSGDSTNGTSFTTFRFLNEDGDVAGRSQRYNGANAVGNAAWVYNGTTLTQVGLTDDEHTLTTTGVQNDTQDSDILRFNEAGQAAGTSARYDDDAGQGRGTSVWVFNGSTTEQTGLISDDYTSSNGTKASVLQAFNEAGQAAGISLRYQLGPVVTTPPLGQSGWFYDDNTDTTIPLVFSTGSSNERYTNVAYLSDSGVVLGSYKKYNGASLEGEFAFLWDFRLVDPINGLATATMDGFHDLGEMVEDGGLTAAGFQRLRNVLDSSELNHILGTGIRNLGSPSEHEMPYLLTPVPEPVSVALLAMTGILVLPRRRRR
jgi:hypothetical protein